MEDYKIKIISRQVGKILEGYNPSKWLFPGAKPKRHITKRIAEKIFSNACSKTTEIYTHISKRDLGEDSKPVG
jgi:hypothetical protein